MTRKAGGNRARTKAAARKATESRRASSIPKNSVRAPSRLRPAGGVESSLDPMGLYFGE